MSPMPKLSIIVPVYNTGKYLCQCVDSIISQSFTNWELLLVDDGSTDNSGCICDNYAEKDSRIRVFHKLNGGVSSARNTGLDNALGEWVSFVDSDDYIAPTFLEHLCQPVFADEDIDFVQGGCTSFANGRIGTVEQRYDDYIGTEMSILVDRFRGLMFSKLFRLETINQGQNNHALRFDTRIRMAEDMVFTLAYLCCVHRFCFVSEIGYYYRRDNVSSATRVLNYLPYNERLLYWKSVYNYAILLIKQHNICTSSIENRLRVLANSLNGTMQSLFYSNMTRCERLRHIKDDFSDCELSIIQYLKSRNLGESILKELLIKRMYKAYDWFSARVAEARKTRHLIVRLVVR